MQGGVFPTEETFQKIFDEAQEDWPYATEDIKRPYKAMQNEFELYIAALQKSAFRYAYELGFNAGRKVGAEV